MKHCYDNPVNILDMSNFYYIDNRDATRKPFRFDLSNGLIMNVSHTQSLDHSGRLQLYQVTVSLDQQTMDRVAEPRTLKQLQVWYSDGTVDTVEIGELLIHPTILPRSPNHLRMLSGGSSSDGTGHSVFQAEKDVTLHSASYSFQEQLADVIELMQKSTSEERFSSWPIVLPAGSTIDVGYRFQLPPKDSRRFNAYKLMIHYWDIDGMRVATEFIDKRPELYKSDLAFYVKKYRQGGDES
ncbi:hypothetical protein [Paenibacillus koleovorans]|uniref:hypothetical protein n=1 Tax=Paenibacillus koleovorans TaxID=121608 RepID=UPI000FDC9A00|nr:hypothetical protein [Paenibacillus koleovorans]